MPAPPWRHPAPDQLAGDPVAETVFRVLLGTPEVPVALDARDGVAEARERLALDVRRVRRCTPPRRLDRPPAVGRDDQLRPGLVEAFPELPPRRSAAVAKIEVDGRRNSKDLRRAHVREVRQTPVTAP